MITCGAARRLLWPDTGPRAATSAVDEAQSHLAGCAACQRFLADMQVLSDRIRSSAEREEAPTEVRNRLFKSIALARTNAIHNGERRRGRWLVPLAGSIALLAGLWAGWLAFHKPAEAESLAAFADDHMRTSAEGSLRATDSSVVAQWLDERLGFEPRFPLFPGSILVGARLCVIEGQRGAVVEYELEGRVLSYFMVPSPRQMPARDLQFASRAGYRVVAWQDAGLTHALVGSFPEGELTELARYCMHVMMAVLLDIATAFS